MRLYPNIRHILISVRELSQTLAVTEANLNGEWLSRAKQQFAVQQSVVIFNTITSPQFCQGFALCRRYTALSPDKTSNLPLRATRLCQR
jgi:hypothetical protein